MGQQLNAPFIPILIPRAELFDTLMASYWRLSEKVLLWSWSGGSDGDQVKSVSICKSDSGC